MKGQTLLLAAALGLPLLGGCATISPEAKGVMMYSQMSTILNDCKKLGPVQSEVSLWSVGTVRDGQQQAKNNLRDAAAKQYHADSVVLVNMDTSSSDVTAQGMAFNCNVSETKK